MNSDYTTMIKTVCSPCSVPLMFLFRFFCDFPCVSVSCSIIIEEQIVR